MSHGWPYKKNDNAHIEQKNWMHVRKLLGWDRFDTVEAVAALNDLYKNELRLFENLFLPSMKLLKKERIDSKVKRHYDKPKTPFERVLESGQGDPVKIAELKKLKATIDPFDLAQTLERKLQHIGTLANKRQSPRTLETQHKQAHDKPLTKSEMTTLQSLAQIFPALASNTIQPSNLRAISAKNNALRKNFRKIRFITPQVQHSSYLQKGGEILITLGYLFHVSMILPKVTFLNGLTGTVYP